MSDRKSWNILLSHPASGAGCEIFDQMIRTCLIGEVETLSSPIQMWDIRRRWNVSRTEFFPRVEWAMSQGGPSACARCRGPSPWWHGARIAIRRNSIRIPQEDTWCAPLSGLPQGEAHDTRDTPDDSISYSDMLSGSLTKVSKPCYVIPTACHSPCFAALRWCVRTPCLDILWIPKNSPQSRIALVIKNLLKHQNLTQFD